MHQKHGNCVNFFKAHISQSVFYYLHLLNMISKLKPIRFCASLGLNIPQIQYARMGQLSSHFQVSLLTGKLIMLFPSELLINYHCLILSECAPSTSLHVILDNDQYRFSSGFIRSGFVCHKCVTSKRFLRIYTGYKNCSLCPAGTYIYNDENHCLECFAGNENDHLFDCK